ncbi:hypothetical protein BDY24DRAFT_385675 [Mrakia frigida]|uniref:uncharacterized protein n=1 Tax=Mrakia frigida TaxID=29902 RepID=UPI003FCC188D
MKAQIAQEIQEKGNPEEKKDNGKRRRVHSTFFLPAPSGLLPPQFLHDDPLPKPNIHLHHRPLRRTTPCSLHLQRPFLFLRRLQTPSSSASRTGPRRSGLPSGLDLLCSREVSSPVLALLGAVEGEEGDGEEDGNDRRDGCNDPWREGFRVGGFFHIARRILKRRGHCSFTRCSRC